MVAPKRKQAALKTKTAAKKKAAPKKKAAAKAKGSPATKRRAAEAPAKKATSTRGAKALPPRNKKTTASSARSQAESRATKAKSSRAAKTPEPAAVEGARGKTQTKAKAAKAVGKRARAPKPRERLGKGQPETTKQRRSSASREEAARDDARSQRSSKARMPSPASVPSDARPRSERTSSKAAGARTIRAVASSNTSPADERSSSHAPRARKTREDASSDAAPSNARTSAKTFSTRTDVSSDVSPPDDRKSPHAPLASARTARNDTSSIAALNAPASGTQARNDDLSRAPDARRERSIVREQSERAAPRTNDERPPPPAAHDRPQPRGERATPGDEASATPEASSDAARTREENGAREPLNEGGRRRRRRRRRRRGGSGLAPQAEAQALPLDTSPIAATARRLGIDALRPEQAEAMEHVLAGRDTLVVLPTGYGKSLIYQVPAMLSERPTIVISPLIALMRDQERSLRERHVPVIRIDSTLNAETRRQTLARLRKGGRLIVLTTPETLQSPKTRPFFAEAKPGLLCVDEAHCVSEWGHDFRPAYLRLGAEREALGITRVLALTATATKFVQNDIATKLHMNDPALVLAPPQRPNLRLVVHRVEGNAKIERAGQIIGRMPRPGIVYCATTKAVDEMFGALTRAQIPCARYHGGMSTDERTAAQRRFMKDGKNIVMIATSAFGMGIDKSDIRAILHYQVTGSLEQYVQESGRAGRDGLPSDCILLFDPADLEIHVFLKRTTRPNIQQLARVGEALAAWAEEQKPVNVKDLALSAGVPGSTCRALVGQLEELGVVALDDEQRYSATVPPEELRAASKDLAARFDRQKMEDDRRLSGIAEYANTSDCRSVFIRRWFGETDPPRCGRCDRCAPMNEDRNAPGLVRKKKRGGKRGRGRSRQRHARSSAPAPQAQPR